MDVFVLFFIGIVMLELGGREDWWIDGWMDRDFFFSVGRKWVGFGWFGIGVVWRGG